jgi:protein gp37
LSIEPLVGPIGQQNLKGIDWIISGGESGPNARPMELAWIRQVRDLCLQYDIPHFFKQWGTDANNPLAAKGSLKKLDPVGKGGSLLDGKYYKQMPGEYKVPDFVEMGEDSKA